MQSQKSKLTTRQLCYIGIFIAIIAACAQIRIDLPGGVPITLQVWGVALAGLILGPKNGTIAAAGYVLLGAVGAPVFAGFTGGIGIILRHTGGFILSFPILALLAGLGERKEGIIWTYLGMSAGTVVNWLSGMFFFSAVTGSSLQAAFAAAVAPFIVVGIVKIAVLPLLSKSLKLALRKAQLLV
ncbi:MAG: biotin transporter BioY [Oscillospiraceae bacterium]|nr:biotin transporter BioY [Oscillospiraceae bacterium]